MNATTRPATSKATRAHRRFDVRTTGAIQRTGSAVVRVLTDQAGLSVLDVAKDAAAPYRLLNADRDAVSAMGTDIAAVNDTLSWIVRMVSAQRRVTTANLAGLGLTLTSTCEASVEITVKVPSGSSRTVTLTSPLHLDTLKHALQEAVTALSRGA